MCAITFGVALVLAALIISQLTNNQANKPVASEIEIIPKATNQVKSETTSTTTVATTADRNKKESPSSTGPVVPDPTFVHKASSIFYTKSENVVCDISEDGVHCEIFEKNWNVKTKDIPTTKTPHASLRLRKALMNSGEIMETTLISIKQGHILAAIETHIIQQTVF